ncbi:hypothetical protein DBR12_01735 [Acidovorax sp. HMWF029]|nr:hypothetical protein DBR12_01735 [Acidovorax sp. HMWF029]
MRARHAAGLAQRASAALSHARRGRGCLVASAARRCLGARRLHGAAGQRPVARRPHRARRLACAVAGRWVGAGVVSLALTAHLRHGLRTVHCKRVRRRVLAGVQAGAADL